MPVFDFAGPDGKTHSIEGPDGSTPEQAFQILQSHLGNTAPDNTAPPVGAGEEAVKGLAAGLGNQTLGVLGGAGLIREGLAKGTDYLGDKFGFDPQRVKDFAAASPLGPLGKLPSPSELRQTVTDPIVSPDYQPQSLLGKGSKLLGEYSLGLSDPAALASPAGLGRAALTNVAAPALASEAAGKLTEGTPLETPARIGAAFLGAYGASKGLGAIANASALKNATVPLDQLKPQTSAGYDAIRDANVGKPLPANALSDTADQITQALNEKNFRPINAKDIHSAVGEIKTPGTEGAPDVADLLAARARIKDEIGSNPAAAFVALDKVEKAIDKYSPGTMQQLQEADKNWTGIKSNEALDAKITRAENLASGANSGLNLGNKIRQKVGDLLNSSQAKYMTPAMKAELQKVVDGNASQNTTRWAANIFGKGGGVMGLIPGELVGHALGNDLLGSAIGLGTGRGLSAVYNKMVSSSATNAAAAIRRETPMGQTFAQARLPAKMTPTQFNAAVRAARIEHRRQGTLVGARAAVYGAMPDKRQ